MNEREIFMNAPLDAAPEVLEAYLEGACQGDAVLREKVLALIAADQEAEGAFLPDQTDGRVADVRRALEAALGGAEDPGIDTLADDFQVVEGPGDVIGSYKLLQKIGEGGFGVVFMAEQTKPVRRRVALKIIKEGMDTRQVIARFEAERQALAMMEHQNIAKVLDAGATSAGRPYFVMELVRGVPITSFCDEQAMDNKQRLELFQDVCAAVGHAHQKGIIHRDLKPSNILVGLDGDTPIVKVIDFGVAKATQQQLTDKTLFTRFEQFIGTPLYISPEQASLSPIDIDTRSDIYSLGVLLYELLTGKPPIDKEQLLKEGFDEMRRLIREQEAPKPSTRLSTATDEECRTIAKARHTEPRKLGHFIKGDLDWIVLKALEKDRKRRYDTANAFRLDIERFLKDEVVTATPPSAVYRFQKFARRNKGTLVATSAVALALMAGTVVSTLQTFRANDQARGARDARAETEERALEVQAAKELGEERLRQYARADRMVAWDLLGEDRQREALAYYARSCENDPDPLVAYLSSALSLNQVSLPRPSTVEGALNSYPFPSKFSPDGSRVAAFNEGGARVWDATTGKILHSFQGETDSPRVGGVHFEADGNCIVLVWDYRQVEDLKARSGKARIWDFGAGDYRATLEGANLQAWPVAFSGDGSRVLAALLDNPNSTGSMREVAIWDTRSGKRLNNHRCESEVRHARFSEDSTRALLRTLDDRAIVLDSATGEVIASVKNCALHPFDGNGTRIIVLSEEGDRQIYDIARGEVTATLEPYDPGESTTDASSGPSGPSGSGGPSASNIVGVSMGSSMYPENYVPDLSFSPDGLHVATVDESAVLVWECATGRRIAALRCPAGLQGIRFSPDGLRIIAQDLNGGLLNGGGPIGIWRRMGSGEWTSEALLESQSGIAGLSPDGSRFVTWSGRVHELKDLRLMKSFKAFRRRSADLSPDGQSIATIGWEGRIQVLDSRTGTVTAEWKGDDGGSFHGMTYSGRYGIRTHVGPQVVYCGDGSRIASTHAGGMVRVWDSASGRLIRELMVEQTELIPRHAKLTTDGRRLLVGIHGKQARILGRVDDRDIDRSKLGQRGHRPPVTVWDLDSGKLLYESPQGEGDHKAKISPDGKYVTTCTWEEPGSLRIRDVDSGSLVAEFDHVNCTEGFGPDGESVWCYGEKANVLTLLSLKSGPALAVCETFDRVGPVCLGKERLYKIGSRSPQVQIFDRTTGALLAQGGRGGDRSPIGFARISHDEERVLSRVRGSDFARLVELPGPGEEMPSWWPDFLRVLGERHFNESGEVSGDGVDWASERDRLSALLKSDDSRAAELAGWFLAQPEERPIRPGDEMTEREAADRLVTIGASNEDLQRAYRLNPAHPLIHLALARFEADEKRAGFLRDYGLSRLPKDPQWKARAAAFELDLKLSGVINAALKGEWEAARDGFEALGIDGIAGRRDRSPADLQMLKGFLLREAASADETVRPAFEAHVQRFLGQVADSADPDDRVSAALLAMIGPDLALTDEALAYAMECSELAPKNPRFSVCRAMAEYRAGNYSDVSVWTENTSRYRIWSGPLGSLAKALEAMALEGTGDSEGAAQKLGEVNKRFETAMAPSANAWVDWRDQLQLRIVADEAERTIGVGEDDQDKPAEENDVASEEAP